jgi:inosine-uridine nucleoside N-ribohydrolase
MLEPPSGSLRVVIDTDTANEIDDQFALAWALLSQDKLEIEGVYAAPYSFGIYRQDLLETYDLMKRGAAIPEHLRTFPGWIKGLESLGKHPKDLHFCTPAEGMEESYQEILTVYKKLGMKATNVFRGSGRYLVSYDKPVKTEAAEHLIERALANDDRPLYVVAIGAVTNVASALLMAPEIASKIVVTWTSGYPSYTKVFNHSFNMEQDMLASILLFDSGVPLVYLPGYYLGAQLRLSLPEMEAWVRGKGAIGDYLYHLYTHNPIYEQRGIKGHFGRSWVIWDLINFAWLLNPSWVPSQLVPSPTLGSDKYWHHNGTNKHLMCEAYEIDRDGIFRDFFTKLQKAPH